VDDQPGVIVAASPDPLPHQAAQPLPVETAATQGLGYGVVLGPKRLVGLGLKPGPHTSQQLAKTADADQKVSPADELVPAGDSFRRSSPPCQHGTK
jgi:hypothetical protein